MLHKVLFLCIAFEYSIAMVYGAAFGAKEGAARNLVDVSTQGDDIHLVFALDDQPQTRHLFAAGAASIIKTSEGSRTSVQLVFNVVLTREEDDVDKFANFFDSCIRNNANSVRLRVRKWKIPLAVSSYKIWTSKPYARADLKSPANFVRFYVHQIFPDVRKFVWLDNDVLVLSDIVKLFHTDMGDATIALAHECQGRFKNHVPKVYNLNHPLVKKAFGYKEPNDYAFKKNSCFPNAGVMVVDVVKWKHDKALEKFEALAEQNKKGYIYSLGSQPPIVLGYYGKYAVLPEVWNTRNGRNPAKPCLLHYNGRNEKREMLELAKSCSNRQSRVARFQMWIDAAKTVWGRCPREWGCPHIG